MTDNETGAYWTGNAYTTHNDYAVAATLSGSSAKLGTAPRHSGLALRPVKDKETEGIAFNPYLIGTGDLEGNGNYRIQIYNMYGGEPAVDGADIHFTDSNGMTLHLLRGGDQPVCSLDVLFEGGIAELTEARARMTISQMTERTAAHSAEIGRAHV